MFVVNVIAFLVVASVDVVAALQLFAGFCYSDLLRCELHYYAFVVIFMLCFVFGLLLIFIIYFPSVDFHFYAFKFYFTTCAT